MRFGRNATTLTMWKQPAGAAKGAQVGTFTWDIGVPSDVVTSTANFGNYISVKIDPRLTSPVHALSSWVDDLKLVRLDP
jgi:hypothetical protein